MSPTTTITDLSSAPDISADTSEPHAASVTLLAMTYLFVVLFCLAIVGGIIVVAVPRCLTLLQLSQKSNRPRPMMASRWDPNLGLDDPSPLPFKSTKEKTVTVVTLPSSSSSSSSSSSKFGISSSSSVQDKQLFQSDKIAQNSNEKHRGPIKTKTINSSDLLPIPPLAHTVSTTKIDPPNSVLDLPNLTPSIRMIDDLVTFPSSSPQSSRNGKRKGFYSINMPRHSHSHSRFW
ncbi:hypothetical protein C8Q75DRAFT_351646 [Abortiporus biennis]|nr:hypothetical protein C8Q75DRAFT_351646 [Abortiporus biennis]